IVVAEGVCSGDEIKKLIQKKIDSETRVIVLGYLQRGGSPSAYDRVIASKMGAKAIDLLVNGQEDLMVGFRNGRLIETPFVKVEEYKPGFDFSDYKLAASLSGK